MHIGSDNWKTLIRKGGEQLGLELAAGVLEQFARHARELRQWNEKFNLTAITDPTEIAVKHFLDSLAAGPELSDSGSLLDVGSGAGFPGIPLKIIRPGLRVTLIDASRKKVAFLKNVVRRLGLQGVDVRHCRAEELARTGQGEDPVRGQAADKPVPFDTVISRALGELEDFVRLSLPLVAPSGRIIALKGRITDGELEGARRVLRAGRGSGNSGTDAWHMSVKRYRLPLLDAGRALVTIQVGDVPAGRRGHFGITSSAF
jgi:16S rRNA (guanine527-N7)-methyltransferase